MNILMICYYYPPLLDVGSKRSVAFSENFKKYGWNPIVISVRNPDKHFCLLGKDVPPAGVDVVYTYALFNMSYFLGKLNGLFAKLRKLFKLKPTPRSFLVNLLCIPDIFIGWIPLTVLKSVQVIRQRNIDVIYVSCSPFSSAAIGVLLKKITKNPLVVDFRDPYALEEVGHIVDRPSWRIKINRAFESWVIKESDIFIVNTEETKASYLNQYPSSKGKTHAVTNGFDFRYSIEEKMPKFEKFTVIYAGHFYLYDKRNDVQTEAFFDGIRILKSKKHIHHENFQFLYFGVESQSLYEIGKRHAVEDLLICNERRPYIEVLQNLKKAHMQLLRIAKPMISTKLFEGIALDVPFLATIPGGEVEKIVNTYSPASYVITDHSPKKIAEAILDCRTRYRNGEIIPNNIEEFKKNFSREKLSLMLLNIIKDNLIENQVIKKKLFARIE